MSFLINGELNDQIAISDRGLQYGDGLFETIAVEDGQCEHWHEHMSRLAEGCERLKIPVPDAQLLLSEAQQLFADKHLAVLKIMITRGSGGRGYKIPDTVSATRIISIHEWPTLPSMNKVLGIQLHLCETKLSHQPALAGIKHLNRLEQVLARSEWQDTDIGEGLMADINGNIIEGTMSNYFAVINGELITPEIVDCGVAGIMRAHIIRQAVLHEITVRERNMKIDELLLADEIFVCNSIIGIWPVRQLLDTHYNVIGHVTAKIMNGLV